MKRHIHSILKDLGLTETEAGVYEALLDLGPSVVSSIASAAKINRTTCYSILDSLSQKKMVRKSKFRGKLSYSIDDPTRIIINLEEEKKQLEATLQKAKVFESELTRLYVQKYTKPVIKYVEGFEGIKELYEDSLRCFDKIQGIRAYSSPRDLFREDLSEYSDWYFSERTRRNIPIRTIVPDNDHGKELKRVSQKFMRTVRLLPQKKFDFSPEIYLYDNKFSVMSFKEKFGFLLESKEIVDALKTAWDLGWEKAREYDADIQL